MAKLSALLIIFYKVILPEVVQCRRQHVCNCKTQHPLRTRFLDILRQLVGLDYVLNRSVAHPSRNQIITNISLILLVSSTN